MGTYRPREWKTAEKAEVGCGWWKSCFSSVHLVRTCPHHRDRTLYLAENTGNLLTVTGLTSLLHS